MVPNKRTMHEFIFRTDGYFHIPDFQRPYTWDGYQIDTFLEDIEKVANNDKMHYFGTIVSIKESDHSSIIDGQQRLTTSLLLILAIYHILKKHPEKSSNYNDEHIKSQYLLNTYSSNIQNRNKITLKTVTTDNKVFEKIFRNTEISAEDKANKLFKTYIRFKTFLNTKDNIDIYIDSLKKFEIVEIIIDAKDDNPQLIFENINSTGKPLTSGDKIRNWALMLNDPKARIFVYDKYWKEIEKELTITEKNEQKEYITDFSPCTKKKIFSLRYLQTDTINSFVVSLFVDYTEEKLTKEEVMKSLDILESFIVRRMICDISSEGSNTRFPTLYKRIREMQENNIGKTFNDCFAALLLSVSGRTNALPTDVDIKNAIVSLNFYDKKTWQKQFILAKICDQSKESTLLHQIKNKHIKLSIEHIMPQTLSNEWKSELGNNFESVHNKWLHSLANLTLTGYNSKYLNKSFNFKKTITDGFKDSPLKINQYIADFDVWNEESLEKRAEWLVEQIQKIWIYPTTTLQNIAKQVQITDEDKVWTPYNWNVETFTKPNTLFINNEKYEDISNWINMYIKILIYIQENFPDKFSDLVDNAEFRIAGRPLITKDKSIPNSEYEIIHGIFIERNLGIPAIMNNIKKICEFIGYSEKDCPFSFSFRKD